MLIFYKIITTFMYPLFIILIYFRKLKKREHTSRYKEKIFPSHFKNISPKKDPLLWFHAASIGELSSILPIIEYLNHTDDYQFLITTTTVSSSELAEKKFKNLSNVHHRFFPLDVNFLMSKFINLWKPSVIFLVDSEIWPNLIIEINKNKIPLALINARITSKTFKRWNFFLASAKKIFSLIDLAITANKETKNYLKIFNVKKINYHGNIKLFSKIETNDFGNPNGKFLAKNKFWLAVSTHKGEEKLCLDVHLNLKKELENVITIIAPRHIARVNDIQNLCTSLNLSSQILNFNNPVKENKEIIIINSFGVLNYFFKYAKSVFIGKSTLKRLENDGGQNPIDAAKLGCKIYHGPYIYNFQEIYEMLNFHGISKKINNVKELSENLKMDFNQYHEKNENISLLIKNIGNQTFLNTIKNLENFIKNASI